MKKQYKIKNYFSDRTKELILERAEIENKVYGRANKNKKSRDLIFKDIQINCNKSIDLLYTSIKNPLTLGFMALTIGLGSYTISNKITEAKFDYKFFKSIENDQIIPREVMVRVQKHYYDNK